MSQFTLKWINDDIVGNTNSTNQNALYRYRLVGGNFISAGFNPANPLANNINQTDSPILDNNKVIQFQIEVDCTLSGPSYNDDGIKEDIEFAEIIPTITKTENSSSITVDVTNTDITKAKFTLRKAADNSIVGNPTIVNKVGSTISYSQSSLDFNTNYFWQIEFYAIINNIEVYSSSPNYKGTSFSPYPFKTDVPSICDPVTSLTVSSIEVA